MKTMHLAVLAVLVAGGLSREARGMDAGIERLRAEVHELSGGAREWRRIAWRSCLADACAEAREKRRPLFLWALGGDPAGRC